MATYTTNLNLKKPALTDVADIADINGNMDILDGLTQDNIPDGTTYKRYSATEKTKLSGIAEGAEVNVNADWNAVSGDAQILNKPTIPSATTVVDNLTSTSTTSALSANQGKVLQDGKASLTGSETLTNKRITKRVATTASSATPTPAGDSTDVYILTALAEAAGFAAPTGTPTEGQQLLLRIKDNGTARALTWNAIYRAMGVALPTTTVTGKTLYVGLAYNSTDSKWDCLAVAQEA